MMRYRPLGSAPEDHRLGRYIPDDDRHLRQFPASAVLPKTVVVANATLELPGWHWLHDQWRQGSCVGHGVEMERAISNLAQRRVQTLKPYTRRYDPIDTWNWAKDHDEWAETNSGDDNGTSVRAGYEYTRVVGPRLIKNTGSTAFQGDQLIITDRRNQPDPAEGVAAYRWARTVDEIRTALAAGIPVTIGVNWYENFDNPVYASGYYWIGRSADLGQIRGGHCVCIYGVSDQRQAFRVKNSWGRSYPLIWMPYSVMERLLREDGEAALVVDR